ncbi:MAG: hypothetical protein PHZ25_01735 [Candidatus Pacebacteria bacterium]|nr:hypothetical protein [Candidatus Paceibacterota bacterium]
MLKVFNSIQTPLTNSFGNVTGAGGAVASANISGVLTTFTTFWDKIIVACFFLALILLFISAFMIDTSPFWIILYVVINFMLILFAPGIVDSLNSIYGSSDFALEASQLGFMSWILAHFGEVLVGVMVITGIIIYGKIAFINKR